MPGQGRQRSRIQKDQTTKFHDIGTSMHLLGVNFAKKKHKMTSDPNTFGKHQNRKKIQEGIHGTFMK